MSLPATLFLISKGVLVYKNKINCDEFLIGNTSMVGNIYCP
jgi:hypothetical protein